MSLAGRVSDLAARAAVEAKALRTLINGNAADLTGLTTTAKGSLLAAINELAGRAPATVIGRRYFTADQALAGGGQQQLNTFSTVFDIGGTTSNLIAAQLFRAPATGKYRFDARFDAVTSSGTAAAALFLQINGTTKYTIGVALSPVDVTTAVSEVLQLAKDDIIGISYYANTGTVTLRGTETYSGYTLTRLV